MTFKSFYDFDMRANRISPELIEITDTEYGDISLKVNFFAGRHGYRLHSLQQLYCA